MNKTLRLLLLVTCSFSIAGCSYMPSWMGGKKKETTHLEGERISVLPISSEMMPDEELKNTPVAVPSVTANTEWAQHTGVNSSSGNLAGSDFSGISSAKAGNGEDFGHTLIPRPIIGGGMVFVMDGLGNISAHDANNIGAVRWQSKGLRDKSDFVIGGGLAYDQGMLFATSGRGIVGAFEAATGKEIWRKSLRIPFRSAPRVSGGKLFATTIDNQLYAFNTGNGEVAWNHRGISETAGMMNSISPSVAGDAVIVPYSSGELYALAASDGHELWNESLASGARSQASAFFSGIGGDPVVDGSVVFGVSNGGMISVFSLTNGQRLWSRPIGANNTPWVAGDYLYVMSSDNTLLCLIKFSGRIRWASKLASYEDEKEKKDPIVWRGPIMTNGKLALVSSNGEMTLVSPEDGKIVVTRKIAENIYTAPVVAGGRMYLESQDATLYSLQ